MEFIKKNWKTILIVLLVVFSLNKCTVACNRDSKIDKQQAELVQKDSIIKAQYDSLNILKVRWNDAQSNKNDLVGVAINTKQDLMNQVNQLNSENSTLTQKVNKLTSEVNKLNRENKKLKDQLNNK